MAKHDQIIKNMAEAYRSHVASNPGSPQIARWNKEVDAIEDTLAELMKLREATKPVPRTLGDISDLPQELLDELSAIKTDELEDQIFSIINASDEKEANIDTILVELFRRFGSLQKRTYITNKLWRMTQKDGIIWPSEGKGYYTTIEPNTAPESPTFQASMGDLDTNNDPPPPTLQN